MKTSGIYSIINEDNGKSYIGSSFDIVDRWRRHKGLLNRNKHHNFHLQQSWNKYGHNKFTFILLETVSKENLIEIEQQYLDVCKLLPMFYYNTCYVADAPMRGRIPWNKGRRGLQIAWNKGLHFSDESKQKMSVAGKERVGNKNPMFGKTHSSETKTKMKLARGMRASISEETRTKMQHSQSMRWRNK